MYNSANIPDVMFYIQCTCFYYRYNSAIQDVTNVCCSYGGCYLIKDTTRKYNTVEDVMFYQHFIWLITTRTLSSVNNCCWPGVSTFSPGESTFSPGESLLDQ